MGEQVAVPPLAAERILEAVAAAQRAEAHSRALIEVAMLALGAPAGSNLVQVQGGGLVFVPPAARPDVGEE